MTDPKIISLDDSDDIVSICDRLDWAGSQRVVLVLPEDGGVLREGLDLVRLRRHADRMRQEIALVTAVSDISRQADAIGIPTFLTVEDAEDSRRGWWRGRRRRERVGLPTVGGFRLDDNPRRLRPHLQNAADRDEVRRRFAPLPSPRRWLLRYLGILIFFITLAFVVVGVAYAIPGATITFYPATADLTTTFTITADPALTAVDFANRAIPARQIAVTQAWRASVETTGSIEVPSASARGQVVFVNQLDQPVTVPAGTRVSTTDGSTVIFQTVAEVEVPGVVGGTAETEVIAVEPGPQGNVDANRINRIEGTLDVSLVVRNLEPLDGGGTRAEAAVTEGDRERLRAQVLQFLQALAASEMEAQLTQQEFLARGSLQVSDIRSEIYSHSAGAQTPQLEMEMEAVVVGTAVSATTAASGLAFAALSSQLPPDYALQADAITFEPGEVISADANGRVVFEVVANATATAQIATDAAVTAVTGQPTDLATAYLFDQFPLRTAPQITIWPNWFGRVPYLPARIRTVQE